MKSILALQHVPHEGLGTLQHHIKAAGLSWRYAELYRDVPQTLDFDQLAGLVVLGGPMNVDEVERYAYLVPEVRWIREAMQREIPILGICLGSQLLAKAGGARVRANPIKEIGWYEIELTEEAGTDSLFQGCQRKQAVFQWHGDTFDLPEDATLLAGSERCAHQAFRLGDQAWGLQFHIEMTADLVRCWLDEPGNRAELSGLDYIDPERIKAEADAQLARMGILGNVVLPRFIQRCADRA